IEGQETMSTSRILREGKTPEQWVSTLAERGLRVSERTLRERARALGACRILGNAMVILPEHIDRIFEEPEPCRSKSTDAVPPIGIRALLPASESEKVRARLTGPQPKKSPRNANGNCVVPLSTARNQS